MYFGADYYPEHWVFPYDGTAEEPESRWDQDAQLMAHAGMNVVRMASSAGACASARRANTILPGCVARWTRSRKTASKSS
jgi:hypothetical protein